MSIQGINYRTYLLDYEKSYKDDNKNKYNKPVNKENYNVQITISNEGHDWFKNKLTNLKGVCNYNMEDWIKESEITSKIEMDIEGKHRIGMLNSISELKTTYKKSEEYSLEDMMNFYLSAYATQYDDVLRGYEDGTREFWVVESFDGLTEENDKNETWVSSNSRVKYRKLTKEEELAALDRAYEFLAIAFEKIFKDEKVFALGEAEHQKLVPNIRSKRVKVYPTDTEINLLEKVNSMYGNIFERMIENVRKYQNNYFLNRNETLNLTLK